MDIRLKLAFIPLLVILYGMISTSSARAGEGGVLLSAGANCSGSTAEVVFSWLSDGAGTQWLDLSLANNGFADGSYLSAGPVPAGQGALTWPGILRGQPHFWRITTFGANGWTVSATGIFTPCPVSTALPPAAPITSNPLEDHVIQSQNSQRAAYGLAGLVADDRLSEVARIRANDMASKGYFAHTSPSGETAYSILSNHGISFGLAGENLARNNYPESQSAEIAVSGFMGSASHRDNVLEGRFTRVGVAVSYAGDMKYFVVIYSGP